MLDAATVEMKLEEARRRGIKYLQSFRYKLLNHEKVLAAHRQYNARHRAQMQEKARIWRLNHPEETRESRKLQYASRTPEGKKMRQIKWLYGITRERFYELYEHQKHRCAICDVQLTVAQSHVDHCHRTKAVRGLLCGSCNRMLGMVKESTESLRRAIYYLDRFSALV